MTDNIHTIICTDEEFKALNKHLKILREDDGQKADIEKVYKHYCNRLNKNPNQYKLNPMRRNMIKTALKRHDCDTLVRAIDGMASDTWKGRAKHNDIRYALSVINSEDMAEKWAYTDADVVEDTGKQTELERNLENFLKD